MPLFLGKVSHLTAAEYAMLEARYSNWPKPPISPITRQCHPLESDLDGRRALLDYTRKKRRNILAARNRRSAESD